MASQRSFWKKASCRAAAVLSGSALTAGEYDHSDDEGDPDAQPSDGFLANTSASITIAVLIGLVAIGLGMLLVARRRKTAAEQPPAL